LAFLRFSRDKRGYENFYLVETSTNRRGKTRARVLYWFRTPPGVKVGREPFDSEARRALEAQNPGVVFDWRKISDTPIPSADAEQWRERRRLERAERARRRENVRDDSVAAGAEMQAEQMEDDGQDESLDVGEQPDSENSAPEDEPAAETFAAAVATPPTEIVGPASDPAMGAAPGQGARRRRRRRRRGGNRQPEMHGGPAQPALAAADEHSESKESFDAANAKDSDDSDESEVV
jgi:hypothetical protein